MHSKEEEYWSGRDKSKSDATKYLTTDCLPHRYLAYRDIPFLLTKCSGKGQRALDYGCGAGISTNFLSQQGYSVCGVDSSVDMVLTAQQTYPDLQFSNVQGSRLPFENEAFDLVFSSFVLFELSNIEEINTYLKEACRVLSRDGTFLAVTGSEELHKTNRDWGCFSTKFPSNEGLFSGKQVKLSVKKINMVFNDYYWTTRDYQICLSKSGLVLREVLQPCGRESEPYEWRDELYYAPFTLFVAHPG